MTAPEQPAAPPPADSPSAGAAPTPGPVPRPRTPVAAAMARLEGVHELPLHEQPDVYQAVHSELQNALAAIDHA